MEKSKVGRLWICVIFLDLGLVALLGASCSVRVRHRDDQAMTNSRLERIGERLEKLEGR